MPAYNAEATIVESIRSALNQTFGGFELIVVDDGSTDATVAAAKAVFDDRCRLISQPNAGPSAARNAGAAETDAEYLAWLDADDIWMPRKLELQVASLDARPEAGFVWGWANVVNNDLSHRADDFRVTHEDRKAYVKLLTRNFIYSGSNSMMRAGIFRELGGWDEALWGAEDWELHCRLARDHDVVCVPEVVVHYRQRPGSLRTDLRQMARDYRAASAKIYAAAPSELRGLRRRNAAAFGLWLAAQATPSHQAGFER